MIISESTNLEIYMHNLHGADSSWFAEWALISAVLQRLRHRAALELTLPAKPLRQHSSSSQAALTKRTAVSARRQNSLGFLRSIWCFCSTWSLQASKTTTTPVRIATSVTSQHLLANPFSMSLKAFKLIIHTNSRTMAKMQSALPIGSECKRKTNASFFPAEKALHMATLTLKKMAAGGIYDHIGGGFAR